jgi:hypothetical protein
MGNLILICYQHRFQTGMGSRFAINVQSSTEKVYAMGNRDCILLGYHFSAVGRIVW